MSYIDILAAEIDASSDEPAWAGGTDDSVISGFEKYLDVVFPESYKIFLRKYGALSFGGDTYYGITKGGLDATAVPSVAFVTKGARARGDADSSMIVVKSSGYGPIYSIDTSIIGSTGEPAVVETELSFKRTGEKNVIYQNFEEFFVSMIREAIAEL